MRNFQNTFETSERSFISAFSICMTVPLIFKIVEKYIPHSLDSNGASNEHLNAKNSCVNEIKLHADHTVY